jgi:hypothetical protein
VGQRNADELKVIGSSKAKIVEVYIKTPLPKNASANLNCEVRLAGALLRAPAIH